MATRDFLYRTKDGEMLDWICWMHYGPRTRLMDAALATDPRLAGAGLALEEAILPLMQYAPDHLRGVVEAVLDANPGLAARGEVLPAGVEIRLPELDQQVEDTGVVHLWDD